MFAICAATLSGVNASTTSVRGVRIQTIVKIVVPIRLNIRWMMVVRFAFLLVPIAARIAVIQVPIFCPNSTYTAFPRPINPLEARACRIPTEAEEDWIIAVKMAPARIHRIGLENLVSNATKASDSLRGIIAALIISIPTNRIPSPARISP